MLSQYREGCNLHGVNNYQEFVYQLHIFIKNTYSMDEYT